MTVPTELRVLDQAIRGGDDLGTAMGVYFGDARDADEPKRNALLSALDELVREVPIEAAGPLAILAGAILEDGADPCVYPRGVFDRLLELLGTIASPDSEVELPDAYYELERGAMACLSRSAELRRSLPQKPALLAKICRYSERYGFLGKMLAVLDDEPLVVLHPSTGRGFRFRIGGIADNFQLHLLLLGALTGEGPDQIAGERPPAVAIAAASNGPSGAADSVGSSWQLANWLALREGGTIDTKDYNKSWIWNEGIPSDIAVFEGTRIVLIGPSTIHRSWNAQRVFSGMPGRLELEAVMPRDESQGLLARLLASTS